MFTRTLALLALASPAFAVTLYTPPLDARPDSGASVWCEAVNVTNSPQTITAYVMDGCAGHVETSYTCSTTPDNPGCAAFFSPDSNAYYFCKFESSASNKSAMRARGLVRKVDPLTGAYDINEQAVPAE